MIDGLLLKEITFPESHDSTIRTILALLFTHTRSKTPLSLMCDLLTPTVIEGADQKFDMPKGIPLGSKMR